MTADSTSPVTWAKFWAVDFHVHTPGSSDVKAENFGTATEIVEAAISAGLDAIAITDHNTASWCDEMARAASGTGLLVLPGVEISTTEGHLLAIWEEGTPSSEINELLVRLGIRQADQGKLDIAADVGFADAARAVSKAGGIAIAAHIDKPKGLLEMSVKAHQKRTLLEECLSAVEVVDLKARQEVESKLGTERTIAFVQGSDTWDTRISAHSLQGIGVRRTWIKASRPDLVGVKHALADPELRVTLVRPPAKPPYARIEHVEIIGGFLDGQQFNLSPDLNCLLGGTGAGKSLVLEAIRYALAQQVDGAAFPAIRLEVDSRLKSALGSTGVVKVQLISDSMRYRVERVFDESNVPKPTIFQQIGTDWAEVDVAPELLMPLAGFSQGEILEYSRQPVGRMTLVDSGIDLQEVEAKLAAVLAQLAQNATRLVTARQRVEKLAVDAAKATELNAQVGQLAQLFDSTLVKRQEAWKKEDSTLKKLSKKIDEIQAPRLEVPGADVKSNVQENSELFAKASAVLTKYRAEIAAALASIDDATTSARSELGKVRAEWNVGFEKFKVDLDAELKKVDPNSSLTSLRTHLESLQAKLVDAQAAKQEVTERLQPELDEAYRQREELLQDIHDLRQSRRDQRRERVLELNAKTAGFVKLDVPNEGDQSDFRRALSTLKVGSHVREDVLDAIARHTHPIRFARALWNGEVNSLVDSTVGIDTTSVARLLTNIEDRGLRAELLEVQLVDRPDVLTVKFRKPNTGDYTAIEDLAHGQRCTAILVILLADGTTPVLVDQPEDALHAPWIEEYLVDRLRSLRGTRQYVFATRSPGIVVSGDAEQIITMRATAGRGEQEANGSLERHDLNKLVLYHLEGGSVPFDRRARKLRASMDT